MRICGLYCSEMSDGQWKGEIWICMKLDSYDVKLPPPPKRAGHPSGAGIVGVE